MRHLLSVIIPASNEEGYIDRCLHALFASSPVGMAAEAVVVANGCRDRTADVARAQEPRAVRSGWRLVVLDLVQGSKPGALNAGDKASSGDLRVYLDADIVVSKDVMAQVARALAVETPVYVGATPVIPRAKSAVTRSYGRFWSRLPFAKSVAPGYGLFAVNAAGRARWSEFPAIISDDTFVRLQFEPSERVQVPAAYDWPMIEGFGALVRVRRRQDAGVRELDDRFPGLRDREGKPPLGKGQLLRLALTDPVGFATYAAVSVMVRFKRGGASLTRGR
jgi:glycosyltransferase involved in cell wall biosynthesis